MQHNLQNPYLASIKERYLLSSPDSAKKVFHMEIDISGSNLQFKPGVSVAIILEDDKTTVDAIIEKLGTGGDETVQDPRSDKTWKLVDFLTKRANINKCSKKLSDLVFNKCGKIPKNMDVIDALLSYDLSMNPQELCNLLSPNTPRFYSIASSPKTSNDKLDITVQLVEFFVNNQKRYGLCTHYLCNLAPLNVSNLPIYIQPTKDFTLPEKMEAPIIMVGPGTGIAPFRSFLQEREHSQAPGKNWLFFGEWNRSEYFYYDDYWTGLEKNGRLKITTAFSREQENKIYVQHRLAENGAEIYKWLKDGAHFYVCGDAKNMAKDVDAALHQICETHGSLPEQEAPSCQETYGPSQSIVSGNPTEAAVVRERSKCVSQ